MIELEGISKVYRAGDIAIHALHPVDLKVETGEYVAIIGPSGSGKSTLMNIVGLLDVPTTGRYILDGQLISSLSDGVLARIRNRRIGFVFQSFNLLPRLTALEQVEVPLVYRGARNRKKLARQALAEVGLAERMHHRPTQLSGGEQQRVAIARAIVCRPSLILADEPTGALDTATSGEIIGIFGALNRDLEITVVFVTHDMDVAHHTRRIVKLRDGRVVSDEPNEPMEQATQIREAAPS